MPPSLRNKAQTIQSNIKHEQRIHGQRDTILHHPASAQNADTGGQRPEPEDGVDGYADDCWDVEGGEEGGDDQGEEGVAYYADGLEEGARGGGVSEWRMPWRGVEGRTCFRPKV